MQKLYIEGREVEVMRSFHDGVGSALVCEFADGAWGYPTQEKVKTVDEVSFLPDGHRKRAERWINSQSAFKNKQVAQDNELSDMPIEQLQMLAGTNETFDRGELMKLITDKGE